jgi:uncharacterized membrane protein YfcA
VSLNLIPGVILGFGLGVYLVKKIKNDKYRQLILLMTGLGGLAIFFQ